MSKVVSSIIYGVPLAKLIKIERTSVSQTRYNEITGEPYQKVLLEEQIYIGSYKVTYHYWEDIQDELKNQGLNVDLENFGNNDSNGFSHVVGIELSKLAYDGIKEVPEYAVKVEKVKAELAKLNVNIEPKLYHVLYGN